MRFVVLAAAVLSQIPCAFAEEAGKSAQIYVHASNVEAANLLRLSVDLLDRKVLLASKLGRLPVSIKGDYQNEDDFLAAIASLLGANATRDKELIRIGEAATETQIPVTPPRENNCPYRYPDIQAAIKAALPARLRVCQPLEFFELATLRVAGILGKGEDLRAIVVSPDGAAWSIKEGSYMGKDFGKVFRVSRSNVDLREIVQDKNDEWQERRSLLHVQ